MKEGQDGGNENYRKERRVNGSIFISKEEVFGLM